MEIKAHDRVYYNPNYIVNILLNEKHYETYDSKLECGPGVTLFLYLHWCKFRGQQLLEQTHLYFLLCVEQYSTLTLPFFILSITKKYHMSRCLILLLLDVVPFSASSIVLLLSGLIVVVCTSIP